MRNAEGIPETGESGAIGADGGDDRESEAGERFGLLSIFPSDGSGGDVIEV